MTRRSRLSHRILALATLTLVFTLATITPLPTLAADSGTLGLALEERVAIVQLLTASQARTLELIATVKEDEWLRRPGPDRWSVGEIVEHLILAEVTLKKRIDALLASVESTSDATRRPLALEQLVALAGDRSQKFQAPEPISPQGEMSRSEAQAMLMQLRAASIQYTLDTDAPLHAISAPAPFGAELTGPGWLGLIGAHNVRHNKQLEETIADLR